MKGWRSAWRSLTKAAGLKGLRFHDLRHQAITELCESGLSDMTIMGIAGHVSKEMLQHYSHIRLQAKRQAVECLEAGLFQSPHIPASTEYRDSIRGVLSGLCHKAVLGRNLKQVSCCFCWSGRLDLNQRPPAPKAGALPGCATPRSDPQHNEQRY
jgi:Phage integrase family